MSNNELSGPVVTKWIELFIPETIAFGHYEEKYNCRQFIFMEIHMQIKYQPNFHL